jgi:subtilisin-like proprotein convertase family protein
MSGRPSWVTVCGAAIAVLLPAGAVPAMAGAKIKTFSSGTINRPIPDTVGGVGEEIAPSIRIRVRGRVKDVNVAVRITHPDSRDLSLTVANPNLKGFQLRENGQLNDPKGADFGAGPATCAGTPTLFDTQAPTSILQGTPPFAGSFAPVSPLTGFNGGRLRGKWSLFLLDHFATNAGVLNCWKLIVRYKPQRKKTRA